MERRCTHWYISPALVLLMLNINPFHLAIPRYLEQEDVYKGYRIPAGAIVIPNSW